jgi:hypothetical protein
VLSSVAPLSPAEVLNSLESSDAVTAGALGFMPRILVLTTLPHRRSESLCFERVNGRHRLRLSAPRRVGLPYGSYPRLLLVHLTTQAVRTKSPEIQLGATPNDLARKLGLATISGPRGTSHRLEAQLHRLLSMRLDWQTSLGLAPRSSGSAYVTLSGAPWLKSLRRLLPGQPSWQPHIVLAQHFFEEIIRSAVPIDLRAIRKLRRSPFAIDIYAWLTYRMSYLKKPTLVPWTSLEVQFGCDYSRLRDFRKRFLQCVAQVLKVYPQARVSRAARGLWLLPARSHIERLAVPR